MKSPENPSPGKLDIELLYLDLTVCDRCRSADAVLDEALQEIQPILEVDGVEVRVRKTHVQTEAQAAALGFAVSPTIRVNGRDIQMDWRESPCGPCGDLCACFGEVSCREWSYQGRWYTSPPKALITESLLREGSRGPKEIAPAAPSTAGEVPENLVRFFSCCGPSGSEAGSP